MAGLTTNDLLLAQMGLSALGGGLSASAQAKSTKDQQRSDLAARLAAIQQQQNEAQLAATQMNPLAQQTDRANFSAWGDVMRNAKPVDMQFDPNSGFGSLSGGMSIPQGGFSQDTLNFFKPANAATAEGEFYGAAGTPYDLAGAGYGGNATNGSELLSQRLAGRVDPTKAITGRMNALDGLNPDGTKKEGGGSWWKTALGIAAPLALNFVLPGSGFLASTAGKALASAGVSAATGALTGGAKGAASGAALGAGSSLLGNRLANLQRKPAVNYAEMGVK